MLYLYYNSRRKKWTAITKISYDLKRMAPRREMAEGDKLMAVDSKQAAKRLIVQLAPKQRARRSRKTPVAA